MPDRPDDAPVDPTSLSWNFTGLRALFLNCTLKKSPERSHTAGLILYSLQHLGYVIPPQADAGWVGEAGPGPSYLDEGSGGPENEFTNRNTTFMSWNLLHLARMLRDEGGMPAYGNQRSKWEAGSRFGAPNPEYR
jgi:multimeric flavodoxin WrbA